MCDSAESANDRDYAANNNHDEPQSHQADLRVVERNDLPGTWRDCRVNTDERDDQHAMLFCHRSAKLVRCAGDFSGGANISGEDCQDGCDVAECNVSAPRESGANENCSVRNAIWYFVVKLASFRGATRSNGNHSIEHVGSQT